VPLSDFAYHGEAAAIAASCCWTATSLLFARASRFVKPAGMNMFRLPFAALCLGLFLLVTTGGIFPAGMTSDQVWLLVLSAFLGLAFGDGFYFRSLALIGPRRATLLAVSTPVITALLAIPLLGESLSFRAWFGIILATAGIFWVLAEQHENGPRADHLKAGITYGLIGAVGQATGLLVAKIAMHGTMPIIPATFLRMASAGSMVWLWSVFTKNSDKILPVFRQRVALKSLFFATLLGPVTGVSLVLFAYRTTEAGVVATLSTLYPLFVVPVVWIRGEDKPSLRVLFGTVVAIGGVAMIFLR
jgi:drug/metabolite transporter (DMT)-like permease